jgi:hypothetical protein
MSIAEPDQIRVTTRDRPAHPIPRESTDRRKELGGTHLSIEHD